MSHRLNRWDDRTMIAANRLFLLRRSVGFRLASLSASLLRRGVDAVVIYDGEARYADPTWLHGNLQYDYPATTKSYPVDGQFFRPFTDDELALRREDEGAWEAELRESME